MRRRCWCYILLFFSSVSSNMYCLYCQDQNQSLSIHYFSYFYYFKYNTHTHTHTRTFYLHSATQVFQRKTEHMPNYLSASLIIFVSKSTRPLDVSYKYKTVVPRTLLLTLDLCDNKDLLWFYLLNPLNLNENVCSLFWISMRNTLSVMAMLNICEILLDYFQHFKNKQVFTEPFFFWVNRRYFNF